MKNIFLPVPCTTAGLFRVTFSHFTFICKWGNDVKNCEVIYFIFLEACQLVVDTIK